MSKKTRRHHTPDQKINLLRRHHLENVPVVRDFFFTVAYFRLDRFHADGFRRDCVPNFYDGCMGRGHADLVDSLY